MRGSTEFYHGRIPANQPCANCPLYAPPPPPYSSIELRSCLRRTRDSHEYALHTSLRVALGLVGESLDSDDMHPRKKYQPSDNEGANKRPKLLYFAHQLPIYPRPHLGHLVVYSHLVLSIKF
ncbi:unnamed protein product [Protopolystoma xenopodis]|uniref:Uncharacterized protein n=1 Tax=Protopolystoma xenopodis TaxID=117903 RepID=A0A448WXY0_9PLAT|nr:unnamed protein product [Protopolystoma xenopodis]